MKFFFSMINRFSLLVVVWAILPVFALKAQKLTRPNILIIMTDQQTASAMSIAGNMDLSTPAMDKLAKNGVRFTKAYCAQPLCTPSRTAIFSGKMPFETRFIGNSPEKDGQWPDSLLMMGKIFQQGGYQTGYVGKWHLPVPTTKVSQHGFGYVENTDFLDYNDGATPSYCARFIKENTKKPFLLVASFLNPHDICEWARGEEMKMDVLADAPPADQCPALPANWEIPANEPEIVRDQQKSVGLRTYPSVNYTPEKWRQYRWAYNRLVEKVDKYIEQVLYTLKKYEVEKNTIIIFTADHGDGYAGHSWNQKQILYEEAAKVPFIIAKMDGTIKPRTDDMLVCNGIDIIPTICGLTGISKPGYLKGVDLAMRLAEPTKNLRDTLVIETDFADNELLLGISGRAVITKDFKYIIYNKGEIKEQLFNLTDDPGEITNLAINKKYKNKLIALRTYLESWCKANGDQFTAKL
ncbi:sulfatase-like hydrolase/transferase [Pedobacter sp. MC2016-05]|uniref:sulfatase family protein n=1 Tax=Pedobacter sp. MC2016-05 TaxID=2994474 RepID=UPI0022466C96|nr:sulfatase-like hydrolase/transferase [Pedobacter sp. MC2016-05]MCX2476997.1 sulfatase-like hydrolase/transferase [Pedobacter sp. MC2016-05]